MQLGLHIVHEVPLQKHGRQQIAFEEPCYGKGDDQREHVIWFRLEDYSKIAGAHDQQGADLVEINQSKSNEDLCERVGDRLDVAVGQQEVAAGCFRVCTWHCKDETDQPANSYPLL